MTEPAPPARPASLAVVLTVSFLGSVSSGVFWAGIFFVTAEVYGFSAPRNLALGALMGALYALAAQLSGRLERALGSRLKPRALLAGMLGCWALAAFAPVVARSEPVLWAAAVMGAIGSALTWPILESYLASGRHGARMRAAIGWFNVTWTPATALPLLLLPALARVDPMWTIGLAGVTNAAAVLLVLAALPARPAPHLPEAAAAAVGREYPWLLRSVARLLPLSYVLLSTLSPVLPHRLREIGAGATVPISVVAASWMLARFVTLVAMSWLHAWHGRWGALVLGGASLAGGLALTLLGDSLPVVVAGLLVFGAGMGLIYYAALYYTLAVGRAAVAASGSFEALIGLGYGVGPLLGLAGYATTAGGARAASVTVALAWTIAGAVSIAAVGPYLAARRARRG